MLGLDEEIVILHHPEEDFEMDEDQVRQFVLDEGRDEFATEDKRDSGKW